MSSSVFARLVEKTKIAPVRNSIVSLAFLFTVSFATVTLGQLSPRDPGVRVGTVDAGQPLDLSKTAGASSFFADGLTRFAAVDVVSGQPNNTGLGPLSTPTSAQAATPNPPSAARVRVPALFPTWGQIRKLSYTTSLVKMAKTPCHPS